MSDKRDLLTLLFVFLCSVLLLWHSSKRVDDNYNYRPVSYPSLATLPRPFIDILTFGQSGLYDDFLQVWMIQILGDPSLIKRFPKETESVILRVGALKPRIESFYMFGCITLFQDLDPRKCENLIINGLEVFPNSWRLPMMLGFVYAFKTNEQAKAASMFGLAASREQSPPYVASLTKKIINKSSITDDEIAETMDLMLKVPGGKSRFHEILNQRSR